MKKCSLNQRNAGKSCNPSTEVETLEPRSYLSISFPTRTDYPAGMQAAGGVVTADFNHDGFNDVAVAGDVQVAGSSTTAAAVAVFLGQAGGTFASPIMIEDAGNDNGNTFADDIVVGDFNNDRKLDLAVTNPRQTMVSGKAATVTVFLGNGDGTFQAGKDTNYGTAGATSANLAAGDFNSDGKEDLIVTNQVDHQLVPLLGNNDGTFTAGTPVTVSLVSLLNPGSVVAADFNGDGKLDIAFNDQTMTNGFPGFVANGNGDGTFAAAMELPGSPTVNSLFVDDFNGDSKPDLAIAGEALATNSGSSSAAGVEILINSGTGTFTPGPAQPVNVTDTTQLTAGDFDGDGKLDLAAFTSGQLSVMAGNGDGTLQAPANFTFIDLGQARLAVREFDSDGKSDLAITRTVQNSSDQSGFSAILTRTPAAVTPTIKVNFPRSAIAGQKTNIHASVTLTNSSGADLTGNIVTSLYLSTTNVLDLDAVALPASTTKSVKLKPGKRISVPFVLKSLPSMSSGTYHLLARVTDPAGNTVVVPSGQTLQVVPPQIDLTGAFVSLPKKIVKGVQTIIPVRITNRGNVAAVGTLQFLVGVSATPTLNQNTPVISTQNLPVKLKPGKSIVVRVKSTPDATGTFYLVCQIDPTNAFGDSNRDNNTFFSTKTITVT